MLRSIVLTCLLLVGSLTLSSCSLTQQTAPPQPPNTVAESLSSASPSAEAFTDTIAATPPPESNTSADVLNKLGNSLIVIPKSNPRVTIQMENGQGEDTHAAVTTRVRLTPPFLQTDATTNGSSDILTIAEFATGNTASKQYLVHFRVDGDSLVESSDLLLGEGVNVTALTLAADKTVPGEYAVNVSYVARDPNQATGAPDVPNSRVVTIQNRSIVGGNPY